VWVASGYAAVCRPHVVEADGEGDHGDAKHAAPHTHEGGARCSELDGDALDGLVRRGGGVEQRRLGVVDGADLGELTREPSLKTVGAALKSVRPQFSHAVVNASMLAEQQRAAKKQADEEEKKRKAAAQGGGNGGGNGKWNGGGGGGGNGQRFQPYGGNGGGGRNGGGGNWFNGNNNNNNNGNNNNNNNNSNNGAKGNGGGGGKGGGGNGTLSHGH
jgi:hypothetical protein